MKADTSYRVDTVYLGGGSPSMLPESQIVYILAAIRNNFNMETDAEITIECNPEDITPSKLKLYHKAGINRLSVGSQSFLQWDLDYLKRNHTVLQGMRAINTAKQEGFDNINIDFIIGLPVQTKRSLEDNFSFLKEINVSHISAYLLEEVKHESPQAEQLDHDLYHFTRQLLADRGFRHYEISNFGRPGFLSHHNLKYWKNMDYIGIGASASGYERQRDYKNTAGLDEYFHYLDNGLLPIKEYDVKDPQVRKIITGLRMINGISAQSFSSPRYQEALDLLFADGFLIRRGNRIAVHPDKLLLLNEILFYFI